MKWNEMKHYIRTQFKSMCKTQNERTNEASERMNEIEKHLFKALRKEREMFFSVYKCNAKVENGRVAIFYVN